MRKARPGTNRAMRIFGYPHLPMYILGAFGILAVLFVYQTAATWSGLTILFTGIPVYFLWRLTPASKNGVLVLRLLGGSNGESIVFQKTA
jgi:uncharacterized membrane protein